MEPAGSRQSFKQGIDLLSAPADGSVVKQPPAIHRQSVVDQVYESLRSSILSGELAQGSRIVEAQAAKVLGTSRAPVREAINRLLQAGLVETRPHHGPSVVTMTATQAGQLYRLRSAIECAAIEEMLARPASNLSELAACIDRMRKIAKHPHTTALRSFVEADLQFHQTIWALSGNEYTCRVAALVADQVLMALALDDSRSPDLAVIADNHQPIFDALVDRDIPRATELMRAHLTFE